MLPLDSPRWQELAHVYGAAGDIPEKLGRLEAEGVIEWGPDSVLEEIASAIYHQGDPGTASYAAVPHLMRIAEGRTSGEQIWLVLLCGWIEGAKTSRRPELPDDLAQAYFDALAKARRLAIAFLNSPRGDWTKGEYAVDLTYLFGAIAAFDGEHELAQDLAMFDIMKDCYETAMAKEN
jgi:hypothetical protein